MKEVRCLPLVRQILVYWVPSRKNQIESSEKVQKRSVNFAKKSANGEVDQLGWKLSHWMGS